MPIKHATETLLVSLLAGLLLLTGFLLDILPPFSMGAFHWGIAFLVILAYPIALYPFLRVRRADYAFRALHFYPVLLLLLWLVLELLKPYASLARTLERVLTFGWGLVPVMIGLLLLVLFCMRVQRQWELRTRVLAGSGVLLLCLAGFGEWLEWPQHLQGFLLGGSEWSLLSFDQRVHLMKEKRTERLEARIRARGISFSSVSSSSSAGSAQSAVSSASSAASSARPPHLTGSGPELQILLLTMLAGYCALLHQRARRRA